MLCTSSLRASRAISTRIAPAFVAPCTATAAPFSTTTRPTKIQRTSQQQPSSILSKPNVLPPLRARNASTTTPASTTTTSPSSASTTTTTTPTLTWNRFLALRKTRRKISVATSSLSALATTFVGLRIFVENNYDTVWSAAFGLDPIIVSGMSALGLLGVGWLVGPFFGNAVFNVVYRSIRGDIELKERQFYARIKKHRVDPTSSSMANPVPDYYGEKIGSVADYRRWLKDQRAFNLKRGAYAGNK
ncbi:Pam17-domain-containing protein, partial [Delitschia confertaspora ATCC 74209]